MTPDLPIRSADWLTRRGEGPPALLFHARDKLAQTLLRGGFKLLGALADHMRGLGWDVQVVDYSDLSHQAAMLDGPDLHILMEDRPLYAPRAIHSVPAYLRGFWFFDEVATRNNSSHRLRVFDPRSVAGDFADRFTDRLRNQFIGRNFSKFAQADRGSVAVPKGCLALFAQDFKAPRHHLHYMTVPDLVAAAIRARGDRPLVIKPHPNNTIDELAHLAALHDPQGGVHVLNASIHDILAACDATISLTSAASFEGFLHGKPALLAGQTDFHHNAITLTDPSQMADALAETMARKWQHNKFLTWYLRQNCIEDKPDALPRLIERLQRKGIFLAPETGWF